MNPEQRAALIRERFNARWPSSQSTPRIKPRAFKWWVWHGTGEIAHGKTALGAITREHWKKKWIAVPDPKPTPTLKPNHRQPKAALTVIAEKAPKKLKRRLASAEQLLAERAQR